MIPISLRLIAMSLSGLSGLSRLFGLFGFSGSSNKTNQTAQMNQINQINKTNHINQKGGSRSSGDGEAGAPVALTLSQPGAWQPGGGSGWVLQNQFAIGFSGVNPRQ
jgi:hypothetical protein